MGSAPQRHRVAGPSHRVAGPRLVAHRSQLTVTSESSIQDGELRRRQGPGTVTRREQTLADADESEAVLDLHRRW